MLVKSTRFYPYFEYLPCYTIVNYLMHAHNIIIYVIMNSAAACCFGSYSTPAPVT